MVEGWKQFFNDILILAKILEDLWEMFKILKGP